MKLLYLSLLIELLFGHKADHISSRMGNNHNKDKMEIYNGHIVESSCICNMPNPGRQSGLQLNVTSVNSSRPGLHCGGVDENVTLEYWLQCYQRGNPCMEGSSTGMTVLIIILVFMCLIFFIAALHFYNKSRKDSTK